MQVMITKKQVKYIQSLSQKKLRDSEKQFVAEGPKIVDELLAIGRTPPVAIYATETWMNRTAVAGLPVQPVTDDELQRLSFLPAPNQVLAIFGQPVADLPAGPWQLVLDGIQDPGNLGTLVRIADWFGISKIVCSADTADVYAPKVVQSSMASIARVSVLYTDLESYIKEQGDLSVIGAVLGGQPLSSLEVRLPAALVIGNESKGIRPGLLPLLTGTVTIPRIGQAESLNAAVATGILLSHLVR